MILAFLHRRLFWVIGGALLAGVSVLAVVAPVLKALGLIHGASLHSWLLDVGHHLTPLGAAGGAGAGAGAAGDPYPPKGKDPDPCAGEERAVLADQGNVDSLKAYLNSKAGQINALDAPMNQLLAQATALAPQAQSEVEEQFALTAITKLVQLMAEVSGLGEGTAAVSGAVGIVGDPVGAAVGSVDKYGVVEEAKFLKEMYQYFQVSQGNLKALEELCKENPLPAASQFLHVTEELNQLVAQGYTLVNAMNHLQDQLQDAQDKLNKDQQALAECQKSNSGSGDSGVGGSGADA